MTSDRQLQELAAKVIATLVYYQASPRTMQSAEQMAYEIQRIALSITERNVRASRLTEVISEPVSSELLARYGSTVGSHLYELFITHFERVLMLAERECRNEKRKQAIIAAKVTKPAGKH